MKKGVHPEINNVDASCVCGTNFKTTSILQALKVEICSNCHPFFSGVQKFVDSAGRIERFKARYEKPVDMKKQINATEGNNHKGRQSKK